MHTPNWWKPFSTDIGFNVSVSHMWMEESLPTWTEKNTLIYQIICIISSHTQYKPNKKGAGSYLACCYEVLEGMDSQTEDVIIMAQVETLGVLLSVVHDPNGSYMVDYLSGLGVEEVAPAIITPVAANK